MKLKQVQRYYGQVLQGVRKRLADPKVNKNFLISGVCYNHDKPHLVHCVRIEVYPSTVKILSRFFSTQLQSEQ